MNGARGLWLMALAMIMSGGLSAAEVPVAENNKEAALRERVQALRDGLREVPLPLIIEEFSGYRVLPWRGENRTALAAVAADVLAAVNVEGLAANRANEAGNAIENAVLSALAARGFDAGRATGASGRTRTAGYPDLEAKARDGGAAFYVEVKTYSAATEDSALRTFYLSPSADFKVTRNAHHLLIAIKLARGGDGRFRATDVRWLDLFRLRCDLKNEFNASNRDLYRAAEDLIVIESPVEVAEP